MKLKTTCIIEHRSSTSIDLPQPSLANIALIVPGASSCSTVGSCCSCSSGAM